MNNESKLRAKIANDFWYNFQRSPQISITFPEVKEISIYLKFNYDEYIKSETTKIFLSSDRAFFAFECVNKDCIHGGFNLSNEIYAMVKLKINKKDGKLICDGYQDYERFLSKNYHCLCEVDYIIEVKYEL